MTDQQRLIDGLESWLRRDDGAVLSERVMDAVIAELPTTSQAGAGLSRIVPASPVARIGLGVAGVAAASILLAVLIQPGPDVVGPSPTGEPSTSPSEPARIFTSPELGFAVRPPMASPEPEVGNPELGEDSVTFPVTACPGTDCQVFVVQVGQVSTQTLADLTAVLDEQSGVTASATSLDGEAAVAYDTAATRPGGALIVGTVHLERSYVISWNWRGSQDISHDSLLPTWDAFLASFRFLDPSATPDPTYTSTEFGFSVERQSDPLMGPWVPAGASPNVLHFPAGTCVADLCADEFVVEVTEGSSGSFAELGSAVADRFGFEPVAATLDGQPAIAIEEDVSTSQSLRVVGAVHGGRSYVIWWGWSGGGVLSVPRSDIEPLWQAFIDSFAFAEPAQ